MLPKLGEFSKLDVLRKVDFGYYLAGGPFGDVLLPNGEVQGEVEVDKDVEVFLYTDSEDRIVATMKKPKAKVGDIAFLEVVDVSEYGAFLDWGLMKQLFVPFKEQFKKLKKGEKHWFYLYVDDLTDRIVATTKLNKVLDNTPEGYSKGDKVELWVAKKTDLGFKVIIDQKHWGLVFESEVYQPIYIGEKLEGYVKNVREDGKLDLMLRPFGVEGIKDAAGDILGILEEKGGFLPLNDKSDPELIRKTFNMSKKAFKKGIGNLYKQRLINIDPKGISLIKKP